MYDIVIMVVEVLILLAILGEWRTSHLHYMHTLSKKDRANTKRKATKIINRLLGDK